MVSMHIHRTQEGNMSGSSILFGGHRALTSVCLQRLGLARKAL